MNVYLTPFKQIGNSKIQELLIKTSVNKYECCSSAAPLKLYEVTPQDGSNEDDCIIICTICLAQIENKEEPNSQHWNCLTEIMWGEVPGIQVIFWRMMNRFRNESQATENFDVIYLSPEIFTWAKATGDHDNDTTIELHKDRNGTILQGGNAITLIKSLDVKEQKLKRQIRYGSKKHTFIN